jgi:hypothetical protein
MIAARKPDDPDVYAKLRELNPEAYVAKGMSEAYIGHSYGERPIAIYDYEECVSIMMSLMSMTRSQAEEKLHASTIPDVVGDNLPVFVLVR